MINTHGWLNRNSLRAYPIRENAFRESFSTGWLLPDHLLADAFLIIPEDGDSVYVSSVTISRMILSVCFSSVISGAVLGSVSAVAGVDRAYAQKQVSPLSDGVSGYVAFGSILDTLSFDHLPLGQHLFDSSVRLETRSVIATGPFPVKSLSAHGRKTIGGSVTLDPGSSMVVSTSTDVDDGDPITYITVGLAIPEEFLSPCETPTSNCQCPSVPITSINGVVGDIDGNITIELLDENASITLMSESVLNFILTRTGESCSRPVMPDEYGRLADSTGDYTHDIKPITPYKSPEDTTFPEPPQ